MRAPIVCRTADITYRQLDYWTRVGYTRPRRNVFGTGDYRDYAPDEVAFICRMAQLVRAGMKPHQASHYARLAATTGTVVVTEGDKPAFRIEFIDTDAA